jgi:hypothetical protein
MNKNIIGAFITYVCDGDNEAGRRLRFFMTRVDNTAPLTVQHIKWFVENGKEDDRALVRDYVLQKNRRLGFDEGLKEAFTPRLQAALAAKDALDTALICPDNLGDINYRMCNNVRNVVSNLSCSVASVFGLLMELFCVMLVYAKEIYQGVVDKRQRVIEELNSNVERICDTIDSLDAHTARAQVTMEYLPDDALPMERQNTVPLYDTESETEADHAGIPLYESD